MLIFTLLAGAYYLVVALVLLASVTSWVPRFRWHWLGRLAFGVTEPVYQRVRRLIPPLRFGEVALDLSPVIVLFVAGILYAILTRLCVFLGIIPIR